MSQTKRQKGREAIAKVCDEIAGTPNNQSSKRLRSINRKVDKRKGKRK